LERFQAKSSTSKTFELTEVSRHHTLQRRQLEKQTKAIGIGKISGKIINIKDFRTNRGKPSPYTPKEAIGEDGMTDYNVIDTVEIFDVNNQQVRSFFVTPAIVKQIQRVPNYQSELAAGNVFGPCKAM
jgi:hypothetical protein